MTDTTIEEVDVLLIGAGVMSATLATLLHQLDPGLKVEVIEQLSGAAQESSNAWNNAGTGHAALCELNYTPKGKDGSINIDKAVKINTSFEESKQFWTYLIEQGVIDTPDRFIHPVPHISFVHGDNDTAFLQQRYTAMSAHACFSRMQFSTDPAEIQQWAPLLFKGRTSNEPIAATRVNEGADVDYGALTRVLFEHLERASAVKVAYNQKAVRLSQDGNGQWFVDVTGANNEKRLICARFVFVGAGGAALTLLQKSSIPEAQGYAGFPVSGQWLRCDDPDIVSQHQAKVYSKASVGAPPMSVPHLDTRVVDGKKSLLFGPFAGFTTKFLKTGSVLDLPKSIRFDNLKPMLSVSKDNFPLVKYLVGQVMLSHKQRVEELRVFFPDAKDDDWRLQVAGQRVQIIKKDAQKGGTLQFGTEIVAAKDNSIAALLGASPGASTAVSIMLDLLKRCFPEQYSSAPWTQKLGEIFPARADELAADGDLLVRIRSHSNRVLQLEAQDNQPAEAALTQPVATEADALTETAEETATEPAQPTADPSPEKPDDQTTDADTQAPEDKTPESKA